MGENILPYRWASTNERASLIFGVLLLFLILVFLLYTSLSLRKWLREALWRFMIDANYDSLREGWCFKEVTVWSGSVEIYEGEKNFFKIC